MNENFADLMMVTYNRINLTQKTLESLLETTKTPFRLIVIDNNSTDGTQEYINKFSNYKNEYFQDLVTFYNKKNMGIAIGRNQGLKRSSSNWLCTIDNDVILPNNWLNDCINILDENKQFAAIGVNFERQQYPLIKLNNYEIQYKEKGNLGTACMVFNKRIHQMFGFFNYLDYGIYGLEDSDMGMRMSVMGLKRGYLKEPGIHLGEDNNDIGEYRKMKTKEHNAYLDKFNENCRLYYQRKKSIYIPFSEPEC